MFNFVDIGILLETIFLAFQGYRTGLIGGLLNALITVASFVLASLYYRPAGQLLAHYFSLGDNVSQVAGFLTILVVLEVVLSLGSTLFYSLIAKIYKKAPLVFKLDRYLGVVPSVAVGLFLMPCKKT